MQGLLEFTKTLGAPRIAAMVAVTIALVGFFAFLILRVTAPQMMPLFTDLSYEDSAAIVKDLERQGINYEIQNEGTIVMVPKDKVPACACRWPERPAQGRRRRLRDFRQIGRAGHDHVHPEHQKSARARRRTGPNHPQPRPRADCPRASGAARTSAILARQDGAIGVDRAQGARHTGGAAGARHPPPGRVRGHGMRPSGCR